MLFEFLPIEDRGLFLSDSRSFCSNDSYRSLENLSNQSRNSVNNHLIEPEDQEKEGTLSEYNDMQEAGQVLVVDDEPMNVFVMKSLLKQERVNADVAYCGNEGVQHVQNRVDEVLKG